jgi:Protein of unknown function (DUF2793)/Chaperone of endosialidase
VIGSVPPADLKHWSKAFPLGAFDHPSLSGACPFMFDNPTPNLALPYLMPAQAQKHVTHNEALRALDALVHLTVLDRHLVAPPAPLPADGACYLVAAVGTAAWAGHTDQIAAFQDGAWMFYAPREGWTAWVADEDVGLVYSGAAWTMANDPPGTAATLFAAHTAAADPHPTYLLAAEAAAALTGQAIENVDRLGINAAADATNRLAVSGAATLLTHAGNGHQIKVNKSAVADTASLIFQTGFSGRAEFGLTGDDNFHVKVSANGTAFTEALVIDAATGNIGAGTQPVAGSKLSLGTGGLFAAAVALDKPAGQAVDLTFQRGGLPRWQLNMTNTAESSTATGSDITITRCNNAGTVLSTPFRIVRASGELLTNVLRTNNTRPTADNAYELGAATARWTQVWSVNGVIQTSDAREKTDVATLPASRAAALVDSIAAVTFRWREGGRDVSGVDPDTGEPVSTPRRGTRRHAGFLAQDMKVALDASGLECSAWGLEDVADPGSRQWLRPDQLIPILWSALRATRRDLSALQRAQLRATSARAPSRETQLDASPAAL